MHDAIQTLYADDPICPEKTSGAATAPPKTADDSSSEFERDVARLTALERRLGMPLT
jgi:hypothetical protein